MQLSALYFSLQCFLEIVFMITAIAAVCEDRRYRKNMSGKVNSAVNMFPKMLFT